MATILADVQRVTKNTQAEFTGEALKIGQWAICLNTDNPVLSDQLVRREASGDYKFYNIENLSSFTVVDVTTSITAVTDTIYFVDTTAGAVTITLPNATGLLTQSRIYKVSDINTPDVTVTTAGGVQNIGDSTTQIIYGESEGLYVVEDSDKYQIIQDNRGGIANKLSRSTTILSGFTTTISGTNTIDVGAGLYAVENPDGMTSPTSNIYRFAGVTDLVITGISTKGFTIIQIDSTTNQIIQGTPSVAPTAESQVLSPRIAAVTHLFGGSSFTVGVDAVNAWWTVGQNPSMRLNCLLSFIGLTHTGLALTAAPSADLKISYTGGELLGDGLEGNLTPESPDIQDVPPESPALAIIVVTQSDIVAPLLVGASALIDPSKYDLNGTLTTIGGATNNSTVQYAFMGLNNTLIIQPGENIYGSLNDAISALNSNADSFTPNPVLSKVATLIGHIVLTRTASDLTNTSQAVFFTPIGGSGGSASTGKYDDLLDTPSSKVGHALEVGRVSADELTLEYRKLSIEDILIDGGSDANGQGIENLGNVESNGYGHFGNYASIGTSQAGGYNQDINNGSYRAIGAGGERGYYFQSYNGVATTMFIGLDGTYGGNVGIGTPNPTAPLDINGLAKSQASITEINNSTPDTLITREYLGELRFTIPAGGTVNITGTNATSLKNAYRAYFSTAGSLYSEFEVAFGIGQINPIVDDSAVVTYLQIGGATGFSFTATGVEVNVTIKAIGETDITQLIKATV